jgi:glycosyltransferase involved in cell wall biosynthesis
VSDFRFQGAEVFFWGIPPIGGLRTFKLDLAEGLRRRGVAGVHAVTLRQDYDPAYLDAEMETAVKCHIFGDAGQSGIQQIREMQEWFQGRKGYFISHQSACFPFLPPEVRTIGVLHADSRATYRWALQQEEYVDAFVCVSQRIAQGLASKRPGLRDRIRCIPHGVPVPAGYPQRGPAGDSLRILYLGRIEERQKAVLMIPRIAARLREAKASWVIVGDGPAREALERELDRRGLRAECRLVGEVPHTKTDPYFADSDVLVFPSRFEGFGRVLIEAMAQGCVPVASLLRGITDDIVEHGRDGFLCPVDDDKALARAIEGLASDRTRLAAMSLAAWEKVRDRFSLQRMIQDYVTLFDEIASWPRAGKSTRAPMRYVPPARWAWTCLVPGWAKDLARAWRERWLARRHGDREA